MYARTVGFETHQNQERVKSPLLPPSKLHQIYLSKRSKQRRGVHRGQEQRPTARRAAGSSSSAACRRVLQAARSRRVCCGVCRRGAEKKRGMGNGNLCHAPLFLYGGKRGTRRARPHSLSLSLLAPRCQQKQKDSFSRRAEKSN